MMTDPGLLMLATTLRDRHRSIVDAVRDEESLLLDELDLESEEWDVLIARLSRRDDDIKAATELLSHRINNLLMAVQTACDYLARSPSDDGLGRLRERLIGTTQAVQRAHEEVVSILGKLL
jgi:light-regulated signal transduction histidine kinase (bacteriophytochrome)